MRVLGRLLSVLVWIGVGVAVLTLLAANTHWVEVVVPSPPWKAEGRWVTLEAQVWALLFAPFVLGVVAAALVARARARVERRRRARAAEEVRWPPNDPDLA